VAANYYGQPIPFAQSSHAEANHLLKSSAGILYSLLVTSGATAGYLLVYDSATVPSDGAVTPNGCYAVPASTTQSIAEINYPAPFVNGVAVVFSTTGCFTQTSSATAFLRWQIM
jgi:hypothetical protein